MHLLSEHGGVLPYMRQIYSTLSTVQSYALLLVDKLSNKPDLTTIALLLVIVLVSLKILDMLYQTVLFWLRMVRKIVFWGTLIGLAVWMYTRGPDGVAEDLQYWFDTWNGEYQFWKHQERNAQVMRQKPAYGARPGLY